MPAHARHAFHDERHNDRKRLFRQQPSHREWSPAKRLASALHRPSFVQIRAISVKPFYTLKFISVTAPNEAEVTVLAYLARTPRVYRGFGAFQALRRFLSSASGISRLSCRFSASMVIESPFFTRARGPPT